jgi:hypothetical protein
MSLAVEKIVCCELRSRIKDANSTTKDPAIAVCNFPAERMNEPFRLSP